MVRLTQFLWRRGSQITIGEEPRSHRHIKHGPVKWRDYKSPFVDPPYWYKWSLASPYSPTEQRHIREKKGLGWYKYNYHKLNYTPPENWLIHVGDKVEILHGKDKGKHGEVIKVIPERNWVVVGGMNLQWRKNETEMIAAEQPLEHHKVALLDPVDKMPTDIKFKADGSGNQVRVSARSGRIVPIPLELLHDRTPKCEYAYQDKDTPERFALERTFVPSIKPLEEELRDTYGITDPMKRKMFWY